MVSVRLNDYQLSNHSRDIAWLLMEQQLPPASTQVIIRLTKGEITSVLHVSALYGCVPFIATYTRSYVNLWAH